MERPETSKYFDIPVSQLAAPSGSVSSPTSSATVRGAQPLESSTGASTSATDSATPSESTSPGPTSSAWAGGCATYWPDCQVCINDLASLDLAN